MAGHSSSFPHLRTSIIAYLLFISFLGLTIVGLLNLRPPVISENFHWRKPVIGTIFGGICIIGVARILFPQNCSRILNFRMKQYPKRYSSKVVHYEKCDIYQGHHPRCEKYKPHIIQIRDRIVCAACTGLLAGGVFSLIGTGIFFSGWYSTNNGSLIGWIGIGGVGLGLFQYKFRSYLRMLLNFYFVFGAFFILISVDALVHSLTFDLLTISMTIFWLITRISISQWDHERICLDCASTDSKIEREENMRV